MRIGFRTWALTETINGLFNFKSVSMSNYYWQLKGENRTEQPIPGRNQVGFYHYYDAGEVQTNYDGKGLLGACMCWGQIAGKEKKERMFRSEYAWILAVTMPQWDRFPLPRSPEMPSSLGNRLWMAAVNKRRAELLDSPEHFQRYVESLAQVVGVDPGTLNMTVIYSNFQKNKQAVERQLNAYTASKQEWERLAETWSVDQSRKFREQMPFPVFDSVAELTEYAKEFGELGPPDRSAPKARSNWWEDLTPGSEIG